MIRTILVLLFLALYVIVGLPRYLLVLCLRKKRPEKVRQLAFNYIRNAAFAVLFLSGTKVEIKGLPDLPADRNVVYILNHRSIYDIIIAFRYAKTPMAFIAKNSLEKVPFLRGWMKLDGCLFLDRDDIREGARIIAEGIEEVKSGLSMGIFPEGTRNRDAEDRRSLLEFRAGSLKLATRTDVPVVPVTMYNASACLEDHFPFIRRATVKVDYGKPIEVSELSPEEKRFLAKNLNEQMRQTLQKM